MGLFMSEDQDPEVYKNEDELVAFNQNRYRQEEVVDMMKIQQKAVENLEKAFVKQSNVQLRKLVNTRYHIETLYDQQKEQQSYIGSASESVGQLDEKIVALANQIEQQIVVQKEIKEQLLKQKSFQQEVLERLENQEALTEKVLRKVDHFRTILYERTHFISEKIGKGYEATAAYFAKMMKQEPEKEEQEEVKEKSMS